MDFNELNALLTREGCTNEVQSTCLRLFSKADYSSFFTDQLTNRASTGWKKAQYIIVEDCPKDKTSDLLEKWVILTESYKNQFLLLRDRDERKYYIYNSKGVLLGDDSILERLVKNNRQAAAQIEPSEPIITYGLGKNTIFYGVPGCGKSRHINDTYCSDKKYIERTVFHPDYTYSDFVGSIQPESDDEGHISYPFHPGPFTRILEKAQNDKDKENHKYYLIIEEINRGNAPAIFGEVFQLLDRKNGESEYEINNAEIAKVVYKDASHPVKIPKNLFLLATMNTADQNVFTLDTAFKRRWEMQNIPNVFEGSTYEHKKLCGTDIEWADFANKINERIEEFSTGNFNNEDKRFGPYFLKENEFSDVNLFGEKVLFYLWSDVFKYSPDAIFMPKYTTLEGLLKDFKDENTRFKVFKDFNGDSSSGD